MNCLPLDITVVSADGIKKVNTFSKMDVFVVVSVIIGYNNRIKNTTPVHKNGGTSPTWNHRLRFVVDEDSVNNPGAAFVHFQLVSERTFGNKDIGAVRVAVDELFGQWSKDSGDGAERIMEYEVLTRSEKKKGTLKFSFKFGEKFTRAENFGDKLTAYPLQEAGSSMPYAPPPGMGYHAPPPGMGYHAPPPGMGYHAPPPGMGYHAPPPGMGYNAPHQGIGYHPPPQMVPPIGYAPQPGCGYPPPPQGYGHAPPPHGVGYGYPPAMQQHAPPKKSKFGMGAGLGLGAGLLGGMLVGDMISDVGEMAAYEDGYEEVEDMGGYDF